MRLFTIVLVICSVSLMAQGITKEDVLSTDGLRAVGGITYSTVGGGDAGDIDGLGYLLGYKFGVEKFLPGGLLAGLTYTYRGYMVDNSDFDFKTEVTLKYWTLAVYKPFTIGGFDVFGGGSLGYFWGGKFKMSSDGESDSESISRSEWVDDADGSGIDYGLVGKIINKLENLK